VLDERHHQNLTPRHPLVDEDNFFCMTKPKLKSVSNSMKGDDTKFMIKYPVTTYNILAVILRIHMPLYIIYLKIKIQ
jgi:hypothetical protein